MIIKKILKGKGPLFPFPLWGPSEWKGLNARHLLNTPRWWGKRKRENGLSLVGFVVSWSL